MHECTKLGVEILKYVVSLGCPLDSGMAPAHTDVISDANVTLLAPTHFNQRLVLSVYDKEHFLGLTVQRFKDYEVFLRFLYLHYVYYSIIVSDLEREDLFAEFTVKFLEFNDDLIPVYLHSALGL